MDKPWQDIPIQDCGEPLEPLPDDLARVRPHPYQQLGAPYGKASPYLLRAGVLRRLLQTQKQLQRQRPGWQIQIFDAYRPNAVQAYMVKHTYEALRAAAIEGRSEAELWEQVYTFWAQPSELPTNPPAHSTGAAIDLQLLDEQAELVDMGTPIDDFTERAHPEYFRKRTDADSRRIQANRDQLRQLMQDQGFAQHPHEWWHFSHGDQLWAWQTRQAGGQAPTARYGRASLI